MSETKEVPLTYDPQEPEDIIVLDLKKKKRKKRRRYSKGLKEFQQMERHLMRASHRMARAVEKGISNYRSESEKSSKKKKDGALRDFIPNTGVAMSRALKEAAPIPGDVAKAMSTKPMRRRVRRQLRNIGRTLRLRR